MLDIKNRMKNSIGGLTMVYLCGDIHGTLDIQKFAYSGLFGQYFREYPDNKTGYIRTPCHVL